MTNRTDQIQAPAAKSRTRELMRRLGANGRFRSPIARYVILALAAIGLVIAALTLLASIMVQDWAQRDIDLRSRLVFRSIRDQVALAMTAQPEIDLVPVFERITEDERSWGSVPRRGNSATLPRNFPGRSAAIA
ncbi:MAG TPA: hypothetical protein VMU69_28675 [Bradyrhizobium sp.]|nr:hypothetical protein [Bradyrhizobium sp.]